MLSRKIPKLKLGSICKGDSRKDQAVSTTTNTKVDNTNHKCKAFDFSISKYKQLGKTALQGVPVLSIFALVGIMGYGLGVHHIFVGVDSDKAFAAESPDTSASLTVDDGKIKDTVFAANGEFAYATHKVTVSATNVKNYTLTLTRTSDLSGPSTVSGAGGKTPANMNNAWGYAFVETNADPTTATYQTVNATNTLTGPAIDSNHNVSGSKQLIFGAKFGAAAANGTYHAEATLSMVATPRIVTNWKVTVNCNGGTGCTAGLNESSDAESKVYTISSTAPTRSGYKFLGYNTNNSATANANYAPGKTITLTAASPTLNLYAVWVEDIVYNYTITFADNMNITNSTLAELVGSPKNMPAPITCSSSTVLCTTNLPSNEPTALCGYLFAGWDTNANATNPAYQKGASITIASNTTLYAIWSVPLVTCPY